MAARGWEGDDERGALTAARRPGQSGGDGAERQEGDNGDPPNDDTIGAQLKPPTTKRKRNLLSESHLLSQEGFKKIYQTFPCQTSGSVAGQEAKALSSLIRMYKQWAYDLYPGLNFEDFVDRTEAIGKTHGVQGLMSDLRSQEMRRVLGIPEEDSFSASRGGADASEEQQQQEHVESEPEESGFIVPGGDDDDDGDRNYSSEEEAML